MADSAAHLVDEVLPKRPIRQWVLSVPFPLRYLFATNPQVMSRVLNIVHRVISTFLIKRSGRTVKPPTPEDLDTITHTIAKRVSRYLERAGYLYRDAESEYLDLVL